MSSDHHMSDADQENGNMDLGALSEGLKGRDFLQNDHGLVRY